MDREAYCRQVLASLRHLSAAEREAVRAELEAHMEDHACALLELGYDERLAEERTMAAMGDPEEVGRELGRQYHRYWDVITGACRILSVFLMVSLLLGIGMVGFVWDSVAYRVWPPEHGVLEAAATAEVDIRVPVGDDILRVSRISVGTVEGERVAEVCLCGYDRIPGGVVSEKLFSCTAAESQRGETCQDGGYGGAGGNWLAGYARLRAPVRPGDDHVTLRYQWLGETVAVDVPLPEEVTP